jgi:hypothetical protein
MIFLESIVLYEKWSGQWTKSKNMETANVKYNYNTAQRKCNEKYLLSAKRHQSIDHTCSEDQPTSKYALKLLTE